MLQSIKKTANGLVALFKDGTSVRIGETIPFVLSGATTTPGVYAGFSAQSVTVPKGSYIVLGKAGCPTAAVTGYLSGLATNSSNDSTGRVLFGYESSKSTASDAACALHPADKNNVVLSLNTETTFYLKGFTAGVVGTVQAEGAFVRVG